MYAELVSYQELFFVEFLYLGHKASRIASTFTIEAGNTPF